MRFIDWAMRSGLMARIIHTERATAKLIQMVAMLLNNGGSDAALSL